MANVVTGILVACAIVVTVLVVRRELLPNRGSQGSIAGIRYQKDWAAYAREGRPIGSPNARVTIVVFADFQCPFCARFARYNDSLSRLGIPVRVLFRHYPLPNHPAALAAARASECAAALGRFGHMHDALFAHPESLGVAPWWWFAALAGIETKDSVQFNHCVQDSTPITALANDTVAGNRLGVRGTPTLLIHDLRIDGVPPFDSLKAYVERAAAVATVAKSK